MIQGIADGIDAATKSPDVVAVVLRGAGGTLTAGYDLTAGLDGEAGDYPAWSTPYGAKGPKPREGAWDHRARLPVHEQQRAPFHEDLGVPQAGAG